DVSTDQGGDSRYVTTTITGAQFDVHALVKLVMPGFAEYEPVQYSVVDSTKIVAIFDLRNAPHALYDVSVINPGGQEADAPYRYLVETTLPTALVIGLGGPRVLTAGGSGFYGFTLANSGNVDIPYVDFQYGIPQIGNILSKPALSFSTNLTGSPDVNNVPW